MTTVLSSSAVDPHDHEPSTGRGHAAAVRPRRHPGRRRDAAHRAARAVAGYSVGFALASAWVGLVLSAVVDLPPSFFVVTIAVLIWGAVLVGTRDRREVRPARGADTGHGVLPRVPEHTH